MGDGLHDDRGIWPKLPGREMDEGAAALLETIPADDPWRTCWEFKLSHDLTAAEGSAFWHGANLARKAFAPTPPAAPVPESDQGGGSE